MSIDPVYRARQNYAAALDAWLIELCTWRDELVCFESNLSHDQLVQVWQTFRQELKKYRILYAEATTWKLDI